MSELRARPWRRRRGSNHSGRSFTLEPPVGHLLGGLVNICSHKDDNLISLQLKKKTLRITRNAASSVNVAEVVKDEAEEEEELRLPVWTRSCSALRGTQVTATVPVYRSPLNASHTDALERV